MTKVKVVREPSLNRAKNYEAFEKKISRLAEKGYEVETCSPFGDNGAFCIFKKEE